MRVRLAITAAQAATAAAALEPLCFRWRRTDADDWVGGVPWPHHGAWVTMWPCHDNGEEWDLPTEVERLEGVTFVLRDLLDHGQAFGWSHKSGDRVFLGRDGQSPTGLSVTFQCLPTALGVAGNGVGDVFRALGGPVWAEDATMLDTDRPPQVPWWRWLGPDARTDLGFFPGPGIPSMFDGNHRCIPPRAAASGIGE